MELKGYFDDFVSTLNECLKNDKAAKDLQKAVKAIKRTKETGNKIMLVGNGGSAAIAEHMAIDFTKNARLRAMTISSSPQITTLANDYGYERVFSKGVEAYADKGDVLIAISSSGSSPNILNAVEAGLKAGCTVITFSGFKADNPLRQKGNINIYVPSSAYGYVELIHNLLIHYLNDHIIGRAVYKFR